jgi:hypothetical protein
MVMRVHQHSASDVPIVQPVRKPLIGKDIA